MNTGGSFARGFGTSVCFAWLRGIGSTDASKKDAVTDSCADILYRSHACNEGDPETDRWRQFGYVH